MTVLKMTDLDLAGKRVLIREDLNVPVKDGVVKSDARIVASLPTIKLALEKGAAVMVCSHLGRPTEGEYSEENSLAPVAAYLSKALGREVPLVKDYLGGVEVKAGDIVLFENVRFNKGEKKNADELAQQYAALCDVFVMDAFGTAHRAEGSTHGVAKFAKVACAGPLLAAELEALGKALGNPAKPMAAIVAGSKVSTKLDVLNSLSQICDQLIVGGGIANTFLAAAGFPVGKSLYEADLVDTAKAIAAKVSVPLPVDVVVAESVAMSDPVAKARALALLRGASEAGSSYALQSLARIAQLSERDPVKAEGYYRAALLRGDWLVGLREIPRLAPEQNYAADLRAARLIEQINRARRQRGLPALGVDLRPGAEEAFERLSGGKR